MIVFWVSRYGSACRSQTSLKVTDASADILSTIQALGQYKNLSFRDWMNYIGSC